MKMATAGDIYDFLNVRVPFEAATSFDDAGFLMGERETPVSAVLLAFDITPDVAGEAARLGVEPIISHHPVIFQPLRRMGPQDVSYLLAQYSVGAICAHTNLDLAPGGVSACLAEALGLENIHGVRPYGTNGLQEGFIESLPRRSPPAEFAKYVRQTLSRSGLRYMGGGEPVQAVTLCDGAGAGLLEDAMQAGADALVTADTKHHQLLLAKQLGIILMDAGHFNMEDVVILPPKENLQERLPTVHFQKSEMPCNLAQYL